MAVGKNIGGKFYIHKSAVDTLSQVNQDNIKKASSLLPNGFDYDIIVIGTNTIDFVQSPNWDSDYEPDVGDRYVINLTNSESKFVPARGQIYHRRHLFVKPDYTGFDIEDDKERVKWWSSKNPDYNRIGYKKFWKDWIGTMKKESKKFVNMTKACITKGHFDEALKLLDHMQESGEMAYSDGTPIPEPDYVYETKGGKRYIKVWRGQGRSSLYDIETDTSTGIISPNNLIARLASEIYDSYKIDNINLYQTKGDVLEGEIAIFINPDKSAAIRWLILSMSDKRVTDNPNYPGLTTNIKVKIDLKFLKALIDPMLDEAGIKNESNSQPSGENWTANELKDEISEYMNYGNSRSKALKHVSSLTGLTVSEIESIIKNQYKEDLSKQKIKSAKTSINQVPNIVKVMEIEGVFKDFPNGLVLDYGGGKYDTAKKYVEDKNTISYNVYDPFNRDEAHNKTVLEAVTKNGGADIVVCANVLNVIREPEVRKFVLGELKKYVKPGNKIYLSVYQAPKADNYEETEEFVGQETSNGWQNCKPITYYYPEIEEVFGKGNFTKFISDGVVII